MRNYSLDFIRDDFSKNTYSSPVRKKPSRSGLLSGIFKDSDTVLVLALILLLYSDNCDRALIFALVYIIS